MTDLQDRKRKVLYAIVHDFIVSAEPIGSSQVSKKKGMNLSSATIRNVMSELEERGFLKRPHTSAGRVPTDAGYRFYVDELMKLRPLTANEKSEIRSRVESGTFDMNEILKDACRFVADRAHQAGIVMAPRSDDRSLQHVQFVGLKGNLVLAVLVSSTGIVENKILELDRFTPQNELDRMHNYLNDHFSGRAMGKIRQEILLEMKRVQTEYDQLLTRALLLGERAFSDSTPDVYIEGQSHLFSVPEFGGMEQMQAILRTLEQKTSIVRLLDQCLQNPGVKIFIGEEVAGPEINGLTLITSAYSDAEGNPGMLGVIGPKRIDYARIVPLVDFTSRMITDALKRERKP
ncbi:MAG: heat-inducible transcriptional repressor HrcA [Pseudomonadota bacterium]